MSFGETLPPAIMDALLSMIWRLEARLEASEQSLAMANTTPRLEPEFDPILGRPLTSWDLPRPRIDPDLCSNCSDWNYSVPCVFDPPPQQPSYSESYGGGGGYSNNYNNYYNNEPQAWSYNNYESQAWPYNNYESQARSYNNYESDRYNQVPQTVQYEPPPLAQYYFVAEPPQQQHYYCPPPSYTHVPDVDATLETDVTDSETRVDARTDEIAAAPPLEAIGEEESTPMVDPKLEVTDADAGYEPQFSEFQTAPNVGGDELNPTMDEVGEEKGDFMTNDSEVGVAEKSTEVEGGPSEVTIEVRDIKIETEGIVHPANVRDQEQVHELSDIMEDISCFERNEDKSVADDESRIVKEVFLEVSRRLVIFGLFALAEVYKDF